MLMCPLPKGISKKQGIVKDTLGVANPPLRAGFGLLTRGGVMGPGFLNKM